MRYKIARMFICILLIIIVSGKGVDTICCENLKSIHRLVTTTANVALSGGGTEYWALLVAVGMYADNPRENQLPMIEETEDFHSILLTSPWWHKDHIKIIKGMVNLAL